MNRVTASSAAAALGLLALSALVAPARSVPGPESSGCSQPDGNCQLPNIAQFPGGVILTSAPAFDNFSPTATGPVNTVCFWGAYVDAFDHVDCDDPLPADGVTITLYDNQQSLPPFPGDVIATVVVPAANLSRRATGEEFMLGGFQDPVTEYEWTADLGGAGPVLSAFQCYWIQIDNIVDSPNPQCDFAWEVSPELGGDGDGFSQSFGYDNAFFAHDFDLAWCIDVDLLPLADDDGQPVGGLCFQPINIDCEPIDIPIGLGACTELFQANFCLTTDAANCAALNGVWLEGEDCRRDCGEVGQINPNTGEPYPSCGDPECCTFVCNGDPARPQIKPMPECCDVSWDEACVDKAVLEFQCAAQVPEPLDDCQALDTSAGYDSTTDSTGINGDQLVLADDFTPAADGEITSLYWYGHLDPAVPFNEPPNDFTVRYYTDDDGIPGQLLAEFEQGQFQGFSTQLTGEQFGTFPIRQYGATHAPVAVSAGACYWLEITNDVGWDSQGAEVTSWRWHRALINPNLAPYYSGNGRFIADRAVDGYDTGDPVGGADLAFCLDIELAKPACGLFTLFNTGPERLVYFDPSSSGNLGTFFVGWNSGCVDLDNDGDCLDDDLLQRRSAQPFTLGPVAAESAQAWRIRQLLVDGFEPSSGETNERLHYEIFSRTGMQRPTPADSLVSGSAPWAALQLDLPSIVSALISHPQWLGANSGVGSTGALYALHVDFNLPPGDYWLTVWAENDTPGSPAEFAWFTNTPNGIKNTCAPVGCVAPTPQDVARPEVIGCDPAACDPDHVMMWRASHWPPLPDGFGFGSYSLDPDTTLQPSPNLNTDPDDLYSAAFLVRGQPGAVCGNGTVEPGEECDPPGEGCTAICRLPPEGCPWDCVGNDGWIAIDEFLAILGAWGQVGHPCDFDGGGVGITDFLKILGMWETPCP